MGHLCLSTCVSVFVIWGFCDSSTAQPVLTASKGMYVIPTNYLVSRARRNVASENNKLQRKQECSDITEIGEGANIIQ